jgi:hypothetical protein
MTLPVCGCGQCCLQVTRFVSLDHFTSKSAATTPAFAAYN